MSSNLNHGPSSVSDGSCGLAPHRDAFLTNLRSLGYAAKTIDDCRRVIDRFCAHAQARGLAVAEDIGVELSTTADRQRYITRFIEHLIVAGVLASRPQAPPAPPDWLDELGSAYADSLRRQRGLSPKTIVLRQRVLRRFATYCFGEEPADLNTITHHDIAAFLDSANPTAGRRGLTYQATGLRSLFGFLFATGRIQQDLALSVPRIAQPRSGTRTRHLAPDDIRRLLDAVQHRDDGIGRRNHAMLLVMARLGLRAQEVIAIRLEDIDWRAGEMRIRGKGGQHDRMPIPVEVGEAIAAYLQDGRAGNTRHLFVTAKAPHRPFASSEAIRKVLRQAFAQAGLTPPHGEVRSHLLRHSLAVDLLGKGASLDEVGDVLRHRSRKTTTIYARYDIEALRPLARAWPVPGGVR